MKTIPADWLCHRTLNEVVRILKTGSLAGTSEPAQMLWDLLQLYGKPPMKDWGFEVTTGSVLHRWLVLDGWESLQGHGADSRYGDSTPEAAAWILDPSPTNYAVCCNRPQYTIHKAIQNFQDRPLRDMSLVHAVYTLAGSCTMVRLPTDVKDHNMAIGEAERKSRDRCELLWSLSEYLPEPTIYDREKP